MRVYKYPKYTIDWDKLIVDKTTKEVVKQYDGELGKVVKLKRDGIIYVEYVDLIFNWSVKHRGNENKKVMCVETLEEYKSLNECVRVVGEGVKRSVYNDEKTHKGKHYIFI